MRGNHSESTIQRRTGPWRVAGLVLGIGCGAAVAAEPTSHPVTLPDAALNGALTACIETLNSASAAPQPLHGNADATHRCPGLTVRLHAHPLRAWLAPDLGAQVNLEQLLDLQALTGPRALPPNGRTELDPDRLADILKPLRHNAEPAPSKPWWRRFLGWLRQVWRRDDAAPADNHWLRAWLEHLSVSERIAKGLVAGLVGLVLMAVVLVISNELRAAGVFRRRPDRHRTPGRAPGRAALRTPGDHERTAGEAPLDWDRLGALPPERQITALLATLLHLLHRHGELPDSNSLTSGELLHRLTSGDIPGGRLLARVLALAEGQVYGGIEAPRAETRALLAEAEAMQRSTPGRPVQRPHA